MLENLITKTLILSYRESYCWIYCIIPGFLKIFIVPYNGKQKQIKNNCFLKMFNYFFFNLNTLKTTTILQPYWHAQIQTHVLFSKALIFKAVKRLSYPQTLSLSYVRKSFINQNKNYIFVIRNTIMCFLSRISKFGKLVFSVPLYVC